jgi:ABC-type transporter Mla maintaining outer membrane lipid asymmetry ATPase subunit MlaF
MLYEGSIRQAGSVDQIRATHDPIVRQFIEGRPTAAVLEPSVRRSVG